MKTLSCKNAILWAVLFFGAAGVHAAKVPKVDICHWDVTTETYKKIAVPDGAALTKHIDNHGDVYPLHNDPGGLALDENCAVVDAPRVFARAFIDVDPNDGAYNPLVDYEIATLTDANGNDMPDNDDTFSVNAYPTNFDPCPGGDCSNPNIGILSHNLEKIFVSVRSSSELWIYTEGDAELIRFINSYDPSDYKREVFDVFIDDTNAKSIRLEDNSGAGSPSPDGIVVNSLNSSFFTFSDDITQMLNPPSQDASVQDDGFLDVELNLP